MELWTQYAGDNRGRRMSNGVWSKCPLAQIRFCNAGMWFFDDFHNVPNFTSATARDGYVTYQDSGVTIQSLLTDRHGVLEIAGADAANDEGSITLARSGLVEFQSTRATARDLWFEARLRITAWPESGLFIGLAPEGNAVADVMVNTTGVLKTATLSLVGFHMMADDPDGLDAVYKTAGVATRYVVKDVAKALALDEWFKVGLYYHYPYCHYFVGGVLCGRVAVDATGFPSADVLMPVLAIKNGNDTNEAKVELDWWAAAQVGE